MLDQTQSSKTRSIAADSVYQAYSMHRWNNETCSATADSAINASWDDESLVPDGEDANGPYWTIDLTSDTGCINFIIRQKVDGALINISGGDVQLNFADFTDRTVTMIRGALDVYDSRVEAVDIMNSIAVTGFAAHWVDANTLLWNAGELADSVSLYHSPAATFDLSEEGVITGATEIALTSGTASDDAKAKFPHISGLAAWTLPEGADAKALLKEQLVAIAKNADGEVIGGTMVQIPGALDALYTAGDADADEAVLGATGSAFNLWAPTATDAKVHLFNADKSEQEGSPVQMVADAATGIWSVANDAAAGTFYRYEVTVYHYASDKLETYQVTDPYSFGLSTNSKYSQIVDFDAAEVTPDGWADQVVPTTDNIVIYESHIRDFSALDESTSAANRGKYLAFTETDSVPMKHLKALKDAGLTYIHLMPAFDIATVNEDPDMRVDILDPVSKLCGINADAAICTTADATALIKDVLAKCDPTTDCADKIMTDMAANDGFNWGYDPYHYGAPEGSYSTDPDGLTRIKEFRQMVESLHALGLRVVMDVVYNHTNSAGLDDKSVLDKLVPGYYHRRNAETGLIEQSTCCDNTATEYTMMGKLMTDTLVVWAKEYKVDSFRFDLMGHQPKQLMVDALAEVQKVDNDNYFYGEGWNFGEVANNARFVQASQDNLAGTGIGTFSDRMRDAVRGGAYNTENPRSAQGWASGLHTSQNEDFPASDATLSDLQTRSDQIRVELAGGLRDFVLVNNEGKTARGQDVKYGSSASGYANNPYEIVSYISKHDNQTFWDFNQYKIAEGTSTEDRIKMHILGLSMPLLGQGVPFIHMGVELLRSKSMERDSYNSGDWFNRVDFTGETTQWNAGLPNKEKDEANWPLIKEIIADSTTKPEAADIAKAQALAFDFLNVRMSSKLFSLGDATEIMNRVDFRSVGDDQQLHLIVMSIDDGVGAGEDLDTAYDAVVAIFNGSPDTQKVTLGAGSWELAPALANSVEYANMFTATTAMGVKIPAENNIATVSPFTTAVFVLPQGSVRGNGWPVNTENKDLTQIPPFGNTIPLIRGDMNGWGTTDAMSFVSNGLYTSTMSLKAGSYEFKVADADWGAVKYGSSDTLTIGSPLALNSEDNINLVLADDSVVTFSFNALDKSAATLMVTAEKVVGCSVLPDSTEAGPLAFDIYVKGNQSGWAVEPAYQLTYKGNNIYQANFDFTGALEFKLAGDNWDNNFVLADGSVVSADVEYPVEVGADGAGNNTATLADGNWSFLLTLDDGATTGTLLVQECTQ